MLKAYYDLYKSPASFDFISFLVNAENYRKENGEENIEIIIMPGPIDGFRRDNLPPHDPKIRLQMLYNIVVQACSLLPSVAEVTISQTRERKINGNVFPIGYTPENKLSNYGLPVMIKMWQKKEFPLVAPKPREKDNKLITITLRECSYWPMRNSNKQTWQIAAAYLRKKGFKVLFVRDSESCEPYNSGGFIEVNNDICENAALYESAHANLFVNNGPAWMATFLKNANVTIFKMISVGAPASSPDFFNQCGLPVGSQIGKEGHRIIWKDDTVENILEEICWI